MTQRIATAAVDGWPARVPGGRRLARSLAVLGLVASSAGCILTKDLPDPALDIPDGYKAARLTEAADAPPTLDWWRGFRSRELTGLMEEAQTVNLDIAAATARFKQADAQARIAGAALLPSLSGSGSGNLFPHLGLQRQRPDQWRPRGRQLFGLAERQLRARFLGQEPRRRAGGGRDRDRQPLRSRRRRADHADDASPTPISRCWPRRTGFAPRSATSPAPSASSMPSSSASRPAPAPTSTSRSRRACSPTSARWCRRCGRRSTRTSMRWRRWCRGRRKAVRVTGGSLNQIASPRVTPGLPSELLTQRPDIRRQEAQLASATANVGNARAQFFPSIQLTGQGGYQSSALASLFQPHAAFFSMVGSLTQPIFDGGRILGNFEFTKAQAGRIAADLPQDRGAGLCRRRQCADVDPPDHREAAAAARGGGGLAAGLSTVRAAAAGRNRRHRNCAKYAD